MVEDLKKEIVTTLNQRGIRKEKIMDLVERCASEPKIHEHIVDLAISDRIPLNQKTAWLMSHISSKNPDIITQNSEKILEKVRGIKPDGAIRDILRAYTFVDPKKVDQGKLLDISFEFLAEGNRALAVKYNSARNAINIVKNYPELRDELESILEIQHEIDPKGFGKHAKRMIKELRK